MKKIHNLIDNKNVGFKQSTFFSMKWRAFSVKRELPYRSILSRFSRGKEMSEEETIYLLYIIEIHPKKNQNKIVSKKIIKT